MTDQLKWKKHWLQQWIMLYVNLALQLQQKQKIVFTLSVGSIIINYRLDIWYNA